VPVIALFPKSNMSYAAMNSARKRVKIDVCKFIGPCKRVEPHRFHQRFSRLAGHAKNIERGRPYPAPGQWFALFRVIVQ
jgi:hypothetical protein